MNEALKNFMGKDITTPEGQKFAIDIMHYLRDILLEFQNETGHFYNLEATPAEGTSYRLAKIDKERYPDIITAGRDIPYYTNSTQLPVDYTDDIFETLELEVRFSIFILAKALKMSMCAKSYKKGVYKLQNALYLNYSNL